MSSFDMGAEDLNRSLCLCSGHFTDRAISSTPWLNSHREGIFHIKQKDEMTDTGLLSKESLAGADGRKSPITTKHPLVPNC